MTTQTQPDPKPEQLWRDLGPDENPKEGDRGVRITSEHLGKYIIGGSAGGTHRDEQGNIIAESESPDTSFWQRPVTPGQCDSGSAFWERALREMMALANSDKVRVLAKSALSHLSGESTPATESVPGQCDCAGLRDLAARAQSWVINSKLYEELDRALRKPCTCAGKSAEEAELTEWQAKTIARLHRLLDLQGAQNWGIDNLAKLDDLQHQLTEARRKLAEAKRELNYTRSTLQSGLDREVDDTTTRHLATVAVNALAAARAELKEQPQASTWHSYAKPPTGQDGVKIAGILAVWTFRPKTGWLSMERVGYTPLAEGVLWSKIDVILPKLPPEPEQDADEAAYEKALKRHDELIVSVIDFKTGWNSALDFARNQERL